MNKLSELCEIDVEYCTKTVQAMNNAQLPPGFDPSKAQLPPLGFDPSKAQLPPLGFDPSKAQLPPLGFDPSKAQLPPP
jgi:hypothetical protein